mgnify:CR=1 FL=1
MVTHYLTLKALQREFDERLRGVHVHEIFTQQRGELVLTLARTPGEATASIVVSIDAALNFVVLRDAVARARRNSVDLFAPVVGATLVEVRMDPSDRAMRWVFSAGGTLVLQLYNSVRSNIVLVDERGAVVEAFKDGRELAGTTLPAPPPEPVPTSEAAAGALRSHPEETLARALRSAVPQLGGLFTKEVFARARCEGERMVSTCAEEEIRRVADEAAGLFTALEHPAPVLYLRGETMTAFSPVPLALQSGDEAVTYASVNEGVRDVLRRFYRVRGRADVRKDLLTRLVSERDRAARRRDAVAK